VSASLSSPEASLPVIRNLVAGDLPAVMELERMGQSHPWSESIFRDCFKDGYRLWALEHNGQLQGFAIINNIFDEAHLLNICIHPRFRGQGGGRLLLQHVIDDAVNDGMACMLLEVRASNRVAIRLYRSERFVDIGLRRGYYPAASGREDARVMVLRFT